MAPPIRTRPSFPHSQSLSSGSYHSLLSLFIRGQTEWKYIHRKLTKLITRTTVLSSPMKLGALPCGATQDGWIMVESSDKTWSTGEENGKSLQYSCLGNPMDSMKRQKDRTLKDELPRLVGAHMLLEKNGEITWERKKRWNQSENSAQLWIWLVMEIKSKAIKNNIT